MLGLQGNSSSSKVYRCVACSATFNGLASLLVHQATHANTLSKVSPSVNLENPQNGAIFGSKAPSNQHPAPPQPLSETTSFYICDCGEEFQDFNLMLVHKRSHVSTQQLLQPLNSNIFHSIKEECAQDITTQPESLKKSVAQPDLAHTSSSISSHLEAHTLTDPVVDSKLPDNNVVLGLIEEDTIVGNSQDQRKSLADPTQKEHQNVSDAQEPQPTAIQDVSSNEKASIPSTTTLQAERAPKNNNLMKLLATAYMNKFQPSKFERLSKKNIIPKTEVIPVEITSATNDPPRKIDPAILKLRNQLRKAGRKTKAPAVGKILDSSKKSIVSLTQTFSPVVLLETRQKLIDSSGNGTCGRYQCGRCRKVFQDLDSLTEHHFLHRKERIKCCRHCKQLIIGKLPFPDNHVCPQSTGNTIQQFNPPQKKIGTFHSVKQQGILNNAKKIFFCPLCKHSYSRRYNLKMHKCQGTGSSLGQGCNPTIMKSLGSESKASSNAEAVDGPQISKNVAVGTAVIGNIKVEVAPANSGLSAFSDVAWSGSPKSFLPFYQSTPMRMQHDSSPCKSSVQEEDGRDPTEGSVREGNGGKWTVPLDDEMEVLECTREDANIGMDSKETIPVVENVNIPQNNGMTFFIRDGVKRYPCNKCQKTYSRPSTLRRHLRLCGFRPHGFVTAQHGNSKANNNMGAPSASKVKPIFSCVFCGKTFNRKDNMLTHRKRCQVKRAMPGINSEAMQHIIPGKESDGRSQQEEEGGNWGVMSLPSVLPRRVTCECGAGFTSPRLLLEHLQKHAQESYTCPTCGETVSSWADYEVHLQIHMHPHNHLYKGLQPQRSKPLLLRFQQQPPSQSQSPLKQPRTMQLSNPIKKQQRIVCTRCNNTFSNRCNLRKHISLNRCKGGRVSNPSKAGHCSRCNTHFPNIISLVFHQRSGACKPAVKPVRCHVCLRWFGTVDGLQKHMLTHKQSESHRCDVCQGTYSNLKSLKNHRRKVHRIMAGTTMPKSKQEN